MVWKWELHTGSEVEAMRMWWNGSGSEEEIVERVGREGLHHRSESSSERRVIQV